MTLGGGSLSSQSRTQNIMSVLSFILRYPSLSQSNGRMCQGWRSRRRRPRRSKMYSAQIVYYTNLELSWKRIHPNFYLIETKKGSVRAGGRIQNGLSQFSSNSTTAAVMMELRGPLGPHTILIPWRTDRPETTKPERS